MRERWREDKFEEIEQKDHLPWSRDYAPASLTFRIQRTEEGQYHVLQEEEGKTYKNLFELIRSLKNDGLPVPGRPRATQIQKLTRASSELTSVEEPPPPPADPDEIPDQDPSGQSLEQNTSVERVKKDRLNLIEPIGEGNFGTVYEGKCRNAL